jgi:hypothetical protein
MGCVFGWSPMVLIVPMFQLANKAAFVIEFFGMWECSAVNDVFAAGDEDARSEARIATNSATSSGRFERPSRMPPSECIELCLSVAASVPPFAANRSINASAALVSVNPGVTLFTRMPCGPDFL